MHGRLRGLYLLRSIAANLLKSVLMLLQKIHLRTTVVVLSLMLLHVLNAIVGRVVATMAAAHLLARARDGLLELLAVEDGLRGVIVA